MKQPVKGAEALYPRCKHTHPETGFQCGLRAGHEQDGVNHRIHYLMNRFVEWKSITPITKKTHRA